MPSYGGAHGPDGSKKSGDQGQGSRDKKGGQTGGGNRGSGDRGTLGQQQDRRNIERAVRSGNSAPGVQGGGGVRATPLDTRILNPQTPGWGALGPRGPMAGWGNTPDFNKAMGEYRDRSFIDRALDFLGGSWYDAVKPEALSPNTYAGGTYHTGTNVPGAIAGLGASALGGPLAGLVGGWLGSQIPGGTILHGGDPALEGYNTGTGVPGTAPQNAGGTGNGNGQNALQGLLGMPTVAQTPTAPKPPSATQAPQSLWNYKPATYTPINAKGLMDYGVWSPQHKYAA